MCYYQVLPSSTNLTLEMALHAASSSTPRRDNAKALRAVLQKSDVRLSFSQALITVFRQLSTNDAGQWGKSKKALAIAPA